MSDSLKKRKMQIQEKSR